MSLTLLKYNTDILLEVIQNYESLIRKEQETKDETLNIQIKKLKSQILFLLTAVKKEVDKEKNA